jgi:5-methylcytosine-specific restriction protein A
MIPENISGSNIVAAISYINQNGVPSRRDSTVWDLIYGGKRYPPKYVICIANKYVNGVELIGNEFGGGPETNSFLEARGFEIVPK